jgi:protein involved in polysaccharide export with SLBB domain
MPDSEPDYAVVLMRCDASKEADVGAIPTVRIQMSGASGEPGRVDIRALADAVGQAAAAALGCTVTVLQTPEEHLARVEANRRALGQQRDPPA